MKKYINFIKENKNIDNVKEAYLEIKPLIQDYKDEYDMQLAGKRQDNNHPGLYYTAASSTLSKNNFILITFYTVDRDEDSTYYNIFNSVIKNSLKGDFSKTLRSMGYKIDFKFSNKKEKYNSLFQYELNVTESYLRINIV